MHLTIQESEYQVLVLYPLIHLPGLMWFVRSDREFGNKMASVRGERVGTILMMTPGDTQIRRMHELPSKDQEQVT